MKGVMRSGQALTDNYREGWPVLQSFEPIVKGGTLVKANYRLLIIACIALIAGGVLIYTADPAYAADPLTVAVIDVAGNALVPTETILKVIRQTQVGDPVDPKKIEADIKSIFELGYFTSVDWKMEKVIGGIKVTFMVIENPPLKEIKIEGLTKIDPQELIDQWPIKPGEVISMNALLKGLENAIKYSQEKGFLIQPDLTKSTVSPEGVVTFYFMEMKLAGIKVNGLKKTKESVVRHKLTAAEGEIIDLKQFNEDLQELYRMGLFDDIIPTIEEGPNPDELYLVVEFKERKTMGVGFSVSYMKGPGLGGGLQFTESNLFGLAHSFNTSLTLNKESTTFELSYYLPWIGAYDVSAGFDVYSRWESNLYNEEDPDTLFDRRTNGGTITVGFPLFADINGSVKFKVEQLHDLPIEDITNTIPSLTTTNNRTLTFQLTRNKLNYGSGGLVNSGNLSMFSFERAGGSILGGDTNFYKLRGETRQFFSLAPKHVLGFRLAGGYLTGASFSSSELFLLGGSETLRGYDYRNSSGDRFALFNTEYRYQINNYFEAVMFLDLGDAWSPSSIDNQFNLNVGYGVGMRINVPMLGQFRFDFGFSPGEGPKFYFSFGEMF
jgi:outer membrane protein insertion porin family